MYVTLTLIDVFNTLLISTSEIIIDIYEGRKIVALQCEITHEINALHR